ncbi:MAG TPA: CopG family transcriptional regulator [Clostridia bacterium]|nr:CopG family transcriptional regulator [Clostridia bacterium]
MNTEKISVNVNIVDLGKIDLLIDQGLYTNKTDFFTRAISGELNKNEAFISQAIKEMDPDVHIQIGKAVYSAEKLMKMKAANLSNKLYVIGRLVIEPDVSLELAKATLPGIRVFGSCKMSAELMEYYNLG